MNENKFRALHHYLVLAAAVVVIKDANIVDFIEMLSEDEIYF